uniref:SHSP domain-containing protein n=1 Tax=Rhabditophanes sp. KR3021 TaxID=114890 RepID=A0AC35UCS3_9BILA
MSRRSLLHTFPTSMPPFSPFFTNSRNFFDDAEFDRAFARPYYNDKPLSESQKFAEGQEEVVVTDNSFTFNIDVSHFEPSDLKVNIVDGNVVVEGKHDEKTDKYGTICRSFTRKYALPKTFTEEDVTSELSKDGILTVKGVKMTAEDAKVRNIPIQTK